MKISIPKLFDGHVHLRHFDEYMLQRVAWYTAMYCDYAIVMPNTTPATTTADDVFRAIEAIRGVVVDALQAIEDGGQGLVPCSYPPVMGFCPLIMIALTPTTTPEIIEAAHAAGAVGTKGYLCGTTTNSHGSHALSEEMLRKPSKQLRSCWAKQEQLRMVSSWHGEWPSSFIMDAEEEFLPFVLTLASQYPKLPVVLEHITTAAAVYAVKYRGSGLFGWRNLFGNRKPSNLFGTITAHHLRITLMDVLRSKLRPHNYCMPIAKRPEDLAALVQVIKAGDKRFFGGSDSAPHRLENKECAEGSPGIYTAPILPQLLATTFDEHNMLDRLEDFACRFGCEFYGKPVSSKMLELEKEEWLVPSNYYGIVPFMAGEKLKWRVKYVT